MSARSSESSFTIVFTVEYKMGLAHPETPKRYQAKNLKDVRIYQPFNIEIQEILT